jgi:hypothetical protein
MSMHSLLRAMKHSSVSNYGGIPGLTSSLIGMPGPRGLVRLMECSRSHEEPIIPHSHRFDFHCLVLAGAVRNIIWEPTEQGGDEFLATELQYGGKMGAYERGDSFIQRYKRTASTHRVDTEYSMLADQIHSIFFERGTSVLFLEGPTTCNSSIILEPFVDGAVISTFKVEPWMFKRGAA